ncbi:MAG TPA: family 43 glycosylhydrolase [Spirochaetales bacterium]|nr:family 43 glycosylhydrolase [Spirochaetales bacterium]HRY53483.1 family 43 glycosylhydrolase [Spirochaetia bacterium]HRZ65756.1 family 43 glycosylhydrolase [Spirochaetia bacterium]
MGSRFLALLLVAAAVPASLGGEGLDNPLVPRRADPYILLHTDGYYYFCASVPEYDRIEIRRAREIEGLRRAEPLVVWRARRGLVAERSIWAPELHRIDGAWYLYYASGTSRKPFDVRIRVLRNPSPDPLAGRWADLGKIDTGRDTMSLDATLLELRGRRYLLWAQRLSASESSSMDLYIAPLRAPDRIEGRPSMIARADRPWELRDPANLKIQGPAVLKRQGRIFVAYSTNASDARYCVGLLEADEDSDPLDPASWRKLPGPAFQSAPAARQFGPGHNSFTTSPDGRIDYLVYHARSYERVEDPVILDPNRATRVQAFTWDAEGRPVFGSPVPDGY